MKIRDRIKELRRVRADQLIPNEKNWRTHPKKQREALQGILAEIGFAGAVLAYETESGLKLIDGHLRAETAPGAEIPVLVLDVDEKEANKLLTLVDPIGAMAEMNAVALKDLLNEVDTQNKGLQTLLESLKFTSSQIQISEMSELEEEGKDEEETENGTEVDDEGYVSFTVPLTPQQEDSVLLAIKKAKQLFNCQSSGEALYNALQEWLDAKMQ